jgi:hypothetical protein
MHHWMKVTSQHEMDSILSSSSLMISSSSSIIQKASLLQKLVSQILQNGLPPSYVQWSFRILQLPVGVLLAKFTIDIQFFHMPSRPSHLMVAQYLLIGQAVRF